MNIYLYGIGGVYNYGCEAMVRSISNQFKLIYPESKVIYKTFSYEKDFEALKDVSTVELEPAVRKSRNIFARGVRFIGRKLKVNMDDFRVGIKTDWTKKCDVLVVIGGDVFDLMPTNRDKPYLNERIFVSNLVKSHGGKVLLWGISVGNFDHNPGAKQTLIRYFKDTVDFAVIRDEKSYKYP